MNQSLWKAALALVLGGAAAYFGALLAPLIVLIAAMLCDYATGLLAAWADARLSSRIGALGLVKKLGYIFGVAVAVAADFVIAMAARHLGAELDRFAAFGPLVAVWLILNECISILENIAALGVPVPGFLRRVLAHLKQSAERAGDGHTGEGG